MVNSVVANGLYLQYYRSICPVVRMLEGREGGIHDIADFFLLKSNSHKIGLLPRSTKMLTRWGNKRVICHVMTAIGVQARYNASLDETKIGQKKKR